MSCRPAIAGLLLSVLYAAFGHAAGVESFSPQGEVKGVHQVSVRFDSDMVPLGDPRLPEPFRVDCPVPGKGRWVDGRNWVYDFEHDLPAGLACRFTLVDGSKDLAGVALDQSEFGFDTGGPAIVASVPAEGDRISEDQVFVLGLDAPVKEASLAGHLWCAAEGIAEKIPARLVTGSDKRKVLAASDGFFQDYLGVLATGHSLYLLDVRSGNDREALLRAAAKPGAPVAVVRCGRRLPTDHEVHLVWGAGIETVSGIATRTEQALAFQTRPDFTARLHCKKLGPRSPCLPVMPLVLNFSAPVGVKAAGGIVLSDGRKSWRAKPDDAAEKSGYFQSLEFEGPFPEAADLVLKLPAGLRDQDGRKLVNARRFPLRFKTDLAPPLAKFASDFGVYELNAQPALPLTMRYLGDANQSHALLNAASLTTQNTVEIIEWMRRINKMNQDQYGPYDEKTGQTPIIHFGAEDSIFEPRHKISTLALPKPLPDRETEVVGIPLNGAGFHIVEVASPRLGAALMDKPKPYYVRATALVTNLAPHLKRGEASSLVWVTALDSGRPVAGVDVTVRDCAGKVYAQGRTDASGLFRIDRALPADDVLPGCTDRYDRQLFVTAAKAGDFSFLLSDWGEGISPWRFNLFQDGWRGPYLAHAVLDRSLFRGGEKVAMKLFVRRKTSDGFGYVDTAKLGKEIILRHEGSGEEVKLAVTWDRQGIAEATYDLPKDAKQGVYDIVVPNTLKGQAGSTLDAGRFRVAAYRVPTVRARLEGPESLVNADAVGFDMQAEYLAGGAAARMPVTLRGQLQPYQVRFPDYEDTSFANGPVKVGRQDEGGEWTIGDYDTDEDRPLMSSVRDVVPLKTLKFNLDDSGSAREGWSGLPRAELPRVLKAEAEYRDANGETRASAASVAIYPAALLIGVKPDSWVQSKDAQRFRIVVLDTAGKPRAGVGVQGRLYRRDWYSYRKRVIGGFYAYQHGEEVKVLPDTCSGRTDERGLFFCQLHSRATGSLIFEAGARDDKGNPSWAQRDFWVPEGDSWIDSSDNDRMDLIPEQRHYEIGDKARFHLRMPFEAAQVLVSVEREGVLNAWVTEVRRDDPVIEVPIKAEYGPNVFVSAFAVRGRVAGVRPTATVDLGKPAYRMGESEIQVGWSGYALKVAVDTDRKTYKTRDKVRVKIKVRRPDGSLPGQGAEVALAAVDEGLLELAPNESWKLLDAMMARRGIAVTTSTAQMQVVGKRHYGRKAVPAGGGGGSQAQARELFDTRIFWQARVRLDERGEAVAEVPLNDSLTRFRIVAVADAGVGRFGTGSTDVSVTQDLQLLSGAAPLVREGDRMKIYFTLRNTSGRAMDVDVAPRLNGNPLAAMSVHLDAGAGREIGLPVEVPFGVDRLDWDIAVQERGGSARDRLRIGERVMSAVPVRTYQATLTQLDKPVEMPVRIPDDAVPGRGGVSVRFQSSLAGSLEGVQEYMDYYPWTCLEQQASKAVARGDVRLWDGIAASLPSYLDRDGLAKYWPDLDKGSDTLTAYLLAIGAEAGFHIPEATRSRMIKGLEDFIEGRVIRDSALPTADLAIRKLAAIDALSRYGEVQVEPRWLESFDITPNLWPTSAVLDWLGILERSPSLQGREERLKAARTILRARLDFAGTVMGFSTERSDNWWWLMVNGDSNANRMVLAALADAWPAEDIGRLMRGSLARQHKGHWNTTVANAWGALATRRFADVLEKTLVAGVSRADLDGHKVEQDWARSTSGGGLLPWPVGRATLSLAQDGAGKPWVTVSSQAAIPLKTPIFAGYRITREIQPVSQRERGAWHRGDVMRVRLTVDAQTDMGWVALLDPIPAGATLLGTGLAGDSALLAQGEKRVGWVWPAYEERTYDSFRAYYAFVPKGRFTVEYTMRLNNEGRFNLPPARVEAMYAPELFGEVPVPGVDVKP